MQSFTKTEIEWTARVLDDEARSYRQAMQGEEAERFAAMYQLRAEQLEHIACKLRTALEVGNKRIEIKY